MDEPTPPADFGGTDGPGLEKRIRTLENRLAEMEGRLPDSLIIHPRFWMRVAAVVGHTLAAALLVQAIGLAVALVIGVFQLLGNLVSGT